MLVLVDTKLNYHYPFDGLFLLLGNPIFSLMFDQHPLSFLNFRLSRYYKLPGLAINLMYLFY